MIRLCGTKGRNVGIFVCLVMETTKTYKGDKHEIVRSVHLSKKAAEKHVAEKPENRRIHIMYLHIFD